MGYGGRQAIRSGDIRRFNFTGNGSNTAFDLGFTPATQNQLIVTVNGLVQHYDAFSISGSTITFDGTPASGDAIQVTAVVDAVGVAAIPDGAIANVSTLTASGAATFSNTVTVVGNTTFSNTVAIVGAITTAATFSNTVAVTGNATFSNTVAVGGNYITPYTGFKNRIINGAMVIDQRNAGASVTPTNGASTYTLDRWSIYVNQASKLTAQQSTTVPSTGFINSLLVTSSSAYSVLTGDDFELRQFIEGYNTADLGFGTAGASTVTLSFWVRSSLTGTFGGAIRNSANDRSYVFSYTISSANTWEQKTVTIAGDTSGTWLTTNGRGMAVIFSLGAGSTFLKAAGSWGAGEYAGVTGQTNLVGTNGATFYITGVQLEKGSTATSFDYRPYGTELQLCQRYYQVAGDANNRIPAFCGNSTNVFSQNLLVCPMRAQPSLTLTGAMDFDEYYVSGRTQSSSSVSRNSGGTNFVIATFGNFTGLTRGNPGGFYSATYVLQISAEL
jgi:hypothetical protein